MASLPGLDDRERADIRLAAPGRLVGWWDPARLRQVARTLVEVGGEHGLGSPVDLHLQDLGSMARLTVQFHALSHSRLTMHLFDDGLPASPRSCQTRNRQKTSLPWPYGRHARRFARWAAASACRCGLTAAYESPSSCLAAPPGQQDRRRSCTDELALSPQRAQRTQRSERKKGFGSHRSQPFLLSGLCGLCVLCGEKS